MLPIKFKHAKSIVALLILLLVPGYFLLDYISVPIVTKEFEIKSVRLQVKVNRKSRVGSDYWIFGQIDAIFPRDVKLLRLQCLLFSTRQAQTSAGYIASIASQEPALYPDKFGKVTKDVYWVIDRDVSDADLTEFNLTYLLKENC
ncbi:MAG: hypothetical protein RL748_1491 [Pseudomonadota bacterium]|jgi:hypothetical protein